MIVYDQNHKPQELGDLLAKGGEGGIYHLVDESKKHVLVKIYFPERLAKNKDILEKKIFLLYFHLSCILKIYIIFGNR